MRKFFVFIVLVFVLIMPYLVFAQDKVTAPLDGLEGVQPGSGFEAHSDDTNTMSGYLGTLVTAMFSLLGVIFMSLLIYGGYNWMIARGDEGKVEIAQKTIMRATIGLVITISAFVFWKYLYFYIFGHL